MTGNESVQGVLGTANPALTATESARRIQDVGQAMAIHPALLEVEENVLSTCTEPIEDLGNRFLRARDLLTPLVELRLVPDEEKYSPYHDLFEIQGRLVHGILRTSGKEQPYWINNLARTIPYVVLGMSLDSSHSSTVEPMLEKGRYFRYGTSLFRGLRSSIGEWETSTTYEPFINTDKILAQIQKDFTAATSKS